MQSIDLPSLSPSCPPWKTDIGRKSVRYVRALTRRFARPLEVASAVGGRTVPGVDFVFEFEVYARHPSSSRVGACTPSALLRARLTHKQNKAGRRTFSLYSFSSRVCGCPPSLCVVCMMERPRSRCCMIATVVYYY